MRKISITISEINQITIQTTCHEYWQEDGISIDFFLLNKNIPEKEYLYIVKKQITIFNWMSLNINNEIYFDLELLRQSYPELFNDCDWMKGKIKMLHHIDTDIIIDVPIVSFSMSQGVIEMNNPMKVFLSHKGSNKAMVRNYFYLLKELGYDPWLDEDAMVAGINPDRGIIEGFKDSCACVFFITPDFKDERFLGEEIENARHEKREKGDRFSIITLQFEDENGNIGVIPEMLRRAIWKNPSNELEAFREIVRALPIKLGNSYWK